MTLATATVLAVGLTMPFGRAAPEPGPVFTPWDGLEKGEYYDVALRADGEMCALCNGYGRL